MIPGVIASHNRAGKVLPSLNLVGIAQYNGWAASAGSINVDVAAQVPSVQNGDLLVLLASYGNSGGAVSGAPGTTPSGWAKDAYDGGGSSGAALGFYRRTYAGSPVSVATYTNVNHKGMIFVFRNFDTVTPTSGAASFTNFSASNPYGTVTLPSEKSSCLITCRVLSNNASSDMEIPQKPSNINDARTIYVPPSSSRQYVYPGVYYRMLTAAEGNGASFAPGQIGPTAQWSFVGEILVRGAS